MEINIISYVQKLSTNDASAVNADIIKIILIILKVLNIRLPYTFRGASNPSDVARAVWTVVT